MRTNTNFNHIDIINHLPFAIILIDTNECIINVNQLGDHLLSELHPSITGQPIHRFLDTSYVTTVLQSRQSLTKVTYLNKTNKKMLVHYIPFLDEQKKLIGVLLMMQPYDQFYHKVITHTDYSLYQEVLKVLATHSQQAIRFLFPNQEEWFVNDQWHHFIHMQKASDELCATIVKNIDQSMQYRREKKSYFTVKRHGKKAIYIINAKPVFIKGRLIGFVQTMEQKLENTQNNELEIARQVIRHLEKNYQLDDMIGQSLELNVVKEQAKLYKNLTEPIFIEGEIGTGKFMLAKAMHSEGVRRIYPFYHLNVKEVPLNSLESVLFGHKTDSGLLHKVKNGTLYVEEINFLSKETQEKLFDFIQGENEKSFNIQFIFSSATPVTNKHLTDKFQDLINRYKLKIPPLRERKSDLKMIAFHKLKCLNIRYHLAIENIDEEVMRRFTDYDWPKNIAELEWILEQAVKGIGMNVRILTLDHFPHFQQVNKHTQTIFKPKTLQQAMDYFERNYLLEILKKNNYHKTKSAKELGISIRNLYYKMDKFHIDRGSKS
ncbi:sigma 54-interacting transcriptional regulator [Gracilibacillus sp. YIM 98692]|uniref:sigma 54-interacting transcriptional regulator n=1 Tax=Gracilibacillus sp. YIM 98692 TaxID=2663532 RepID=UPI0013D11327|nr:sigma 54-interacting transcriptional regulator [Gracilibacillus sp. YIM 98692]